MKPTLSAMVCDRDVKPDFSMHVGANMYKNNRFLYTSNTGAH